MFSRILAASVCLAAVLLHAQPSPGGEPERRPVPGKITVFLRSERGPLDVATAGAEGYARTGRASLDALNRTFEISRVEKRYPKKVFDRTAAQDIQISNQYDFYFPPERDIDQILAAFRADPNVAAAYAEEIVPLRVKPNDLQFPQQWNLQNRSSGHDIRAVGGWEHSVGDTSVVLAILDSGTDWFHPDLGGSAPNYTDGNIWINWSEWNGFASVDDDSNGFVDDVRGWDFVHFSPAESISASPWPGEDWKDEDNDPRDFNGHGTHVAGIASAIGNNAIGVSGVSWRCKILVCRVGWSSNVDGTELGFIRTDFASDAIVYAVDQGAAAINASWGSGPQLGAAADYARDNGVVIFSAAGNESSQNQDYFASRNDVIDVASTTNMDVKSSFSNYGTWVDISAPGSGILSTLPDRASAGTGYGLLSGTSMACPHLVGFYGVLKSAHPTWARGEILAKIYSSADDIDALNPSHAGKLGAGRINMMKAFDDFFHTVPDEFETLQEAVFASWITDTVAVLGGDTLIENLSIDRPLLVLGGYDSTYSARDLGKPSVLKGTVGPVLSFAPGSDGARFDGFELTGGTGASGVTPMPGGKYGGAINVFQSSPVLKNMRIFGNAVGTIGFGGGGGIFANDGNPSLINVIIEGNTAHWGGGIMVVNGSIHLEDVTIRENVLVDNLNGEKGAGIYAENAEDLILENVSISRNQGADIGGGAYVELGPGGVFRFVSGMVDSHVVSGSGAGLRLAGGSIRLVDLLIETNTSTSAGADQGGGIYSTSADSLTLASCRILRNGNRIGAGIAVDGLDYLTASNNVIADNVSALLYGAGWFRNVVSGTFTNNTLHGNSAGFSIDGINFDAAPVSIRSNIFSSHSTTALQIQNGTPDHDYNNFYSNGTDIDGASPGAGSTAGDPRFAAPGADDYQLRVHSISVDRGDTASTLSDPDGSRNDQGAFGGPGADSSAPAPVAGMFATGDTASTILTWSPSTAPDLAWYALYRDTTADFSPSMASFLDTVPPTDTMYVDVTPTIYFYRIAAIDSNGYMGGFSDVVDRSATAVKKRPGGDDDAVPAPELYLSHNSPNPFNPTTRIEFRLPRTERARLTIHDLKGRLVRKLYDGMAGTDLVRVTWNGKDDAGRPVASGLYFYRLSAGKARLTDKMLLLK